MTSFNDYLNSITDPEHKNKIADILTWVAERYPDLIPVIKWNQPMFMTDRTYIIGFSLSKNHIAVSPEVKPITLFLEEIEASQYDHTKNIIRIKWHQTVDYSLLAKLIEFNIQDKVDATNFWR